MTDDSPPKPPTYRLGSLRNFLPLSEDTVVSTRGQRLPQLIHNRSSANLRESRALRRPTYNNDDTDEETDVERDAEDRGGALGARPRMPRGLTEGARKVSSSSLVAMTPQMRSARLIGKNQMKDNPRYQW